MSVRAITWAFDQVLPGESRINPSGEKFVLVALADRADDDGYCWPSVPLLAKKCQMGERTVTAHLKRLQDWGVLEVEEQGRANGAQHVNRYHLKLQSDTTTSRPAGAKLAPAPGAKLAPPRCEVGTTPVRSWPDSYRNDPSSDPSQEGRTPEASPLSSCGGGPRTGALSDAEFLQELRENPAYADLDVNQELAKLDAWLLTPRGRGKKKTRNRIVAWLNRAADERREVHTGPRVHPDRCVGRRQDGYRLKPCGRPIAESERWKPAPLCLWCLGERATRMVPA